MALRFFRYSVRASDSLLPPSPFVDCVDVVVSWIGSSTWRLSFFLFDDESSRWSFIPSRRCGKLASTHLPPKKVGMQLSGRPCCWMLRLFLLRWWIEWRPPRRILTKTQLQGSTAGKAIRPYLGEPVEIPFECVRVRRCQATPWPSLYLILYENRTLVNGRGSIWILKFQCL